MLIGALRSTARLALVGLLAVCTAAIGVAQDAVERDGRLHHVGSAACAECHSAETSAWAGSQHRRAMDHATEASVLGDFSGAVFDHRGVRSRFFRRDGRFMVETDGPDGRLAEFEVKYTFGVSPLQQYLIEFPDGRIQALSIAWDSRPKETGGQRWFHLYPDETVRHDDVLHWTKFTQNWNHMCASCHSTGLRKTYDAEKDRFETTWAEIGVGCEACHGKGSAHLAWARERAAGGTGGMDDPAKGLAVVFDERGSTDWSLDPATGSPAQGRALPPLRKEVETCGLCHARRATLAEDPTPGRWLADSQAVAGLGRGLYADDGQMQDEVFDYGSFRQSRMYAKGVTCSDCHDPHAAGLPVPGDGVCLACHAETKFATAAHHHHENVRPTPSCPACHMPTRVYMVVDPRHDHGFRIPRPDLTASLGTPNACNDCHADRSPQWTAAAVASWGVADRGGFQTYARAFHDARRNAADAAALLRQTAADPQTPAFARAAALAELAPHLTIADLGLVRSGLTDPDPMVRIGALEMLDGAPVATIWSSAAPLLADPVLGVRIRAAEILAAMPPARQPPADRTAFDRATGEFVAAMRLDADRPDARIRLAAFLVRRGDTAEAERQYEAALRLEPRFAPAAVGLADLYRRSGRDGEAIAVLRAAIAVEPAAAGLHHALGLALIRTGARPEAVEQLGRAAALDPDNRRYGYIHAVALHAAGRTAEALAVLRGTLAKWPEDRRILAALVAISRDAGDLPAALSYAERLADLSPGDRDLARAVDELRRSRR